MNNPKPLKIVYKKIEDLIPYARNSRVHSDIQIGQIAASIREFGWRTAVLVDGENGIIAGHGRVLAAQKLGLKEIPTIDGSDMTETQKRAYIIADNKIALNAEWDEQMLMLEIQDLKTMGADLSLLAFDESELSKKFQDDSSSDDIPEVSDEVRNLLMIECISEPELQKLFEEMQTRGFNCKILN